MGVSRSVSEAIPCRIERDTASRKRSESVNQLGPGSYEIFAVLSGPRGDDKTLTAWQCRSRTICFRRPGDNGSRLQMRGRVGFKHHSAWLASHACGDSTRHLQGSSVGAKSDSRRILIATRMARYSSIFECKNHGLAIITVWNLTITPMREFPSVVLGALPHLLRRRRSDAGCQHQRDTHREGKMKQGRSHGPVLLSANPG